MTAGFEKGTVGVVSVGVDVGVVSAGVVVGVVVGFVGVVVGGGGKDPSMDGNSDSPG